MSAIGEKLRRERLQRKLGLEQISRELKISQRFLEAIEDDQFDKLPGGVFAKSFVRQYARLLGLDEEELATEVQRVIEPPFAVPQFVEQTKPSPVDTYVPRVEPWKDSGNSRSPLPALALVVVVMLVCSGVYAWWQRQRGMVSAQTISAQNMASAQTTASPQTPVSPQTETPPAAHDPVPTVQAPAAPAVAQPESTPPPTAHPQSAAAQPPAANSADRPAENAGAPPAPRPAATTTQPARPSNPNASVRVEVTADETVWVLARADDKFLFSGTLEANQTRTVEANDKVLLRLGNAGGVSITLNGKPVGAVGPKGQVRTIQFTSGGFHIVAAPKPSLPLDEIF